MASTWSVSLEAAVSEAEAVIDRMTIPRTSPRTGEPIPIWTPAQESQALHLVALAEEDSSKPQAFWDRLTALWGAGRPPGKPHNWDKLGEQWARYSGSTQYSAQLHEEEGSVGAILSGTVEGAADDVVKSAQAARKWGPFVAVALVFLFVGVFAWSMARK